MKVTSPAFNHNQPIPRKYTCQGEDVNPPLAIAGIPAGTKSLALIMDDPDAPGGNWDHWLVYNITPTPEIKENSIPGAETRNDFGRVHYGGPCPPSGTHRYFFKLYALDTQMVFKGMPSKQALEQAMQGHILEKAELIGLYQKTRS
ncbi:MAG: YbhB/YbcL family Raf kinase inhibitor-like protein [Candidatus Omnitrophica bacterium]|nr:YbhB/YbcL family Raf kinase inhibitor-like protein [Candidatus Omnitrophota bacterium]